MWPTRIYVMRDILIREEDAEIAEMKTKVRQLEEKKAVTALLEPYKKGGKIVVHNTTDNRYVIRIPRPLQVDGRARITGTTEAAVYHSVYELLCHPATTLRDVYELAMQERDEMVRDKIIVDETQKRMRRDWPKYFENSALADRPIEEIKASEIATFLRHVTADYELTRSAYTNIKSLLNVTYDYAVNNDIIQNNIARSVRIKAKCKPPKEGTYTDDQRDIILHYIEDHEKWSDSICYAAIYLDFYLCARIGEIKALRWADYDEQTGTIRIEREVVTRGDVQVEVEHTKSGEHGSRTQYLSPRAIELLEHLKAHRTSMLIFPTEEGGYMRTENVNRALKRICNWTGVPYMSSHKIRFWAVTAMVRATGGDITAVGAYAGQHCRQTTLHYIRKAQDEEAQRTAATAVFG